MAIEAVAAAPLVPGAQAASSVPRDIAAGPGASLAEQASFAGAMERATLIGTVPGGDPLSPALKGMMGALEHVNAQAKSVGDYAAALSSAGREMTPAEIISLTMRCQQFMFHCQLSSNIANRTSDGLQQLFRQQS